MQQDHFGIFESDIEKILYWRHTYIMFELAGEVVFAEGCFPGQQVKRDWFAEMAVDVFGHFGNRVRSRSARM